MKLHKTATHSISEINHPQVLLKSVSANDHTDSEPLYDDIDVQPSTITAAQQSGIEADFVHLIKKIALLALDQFKPGDIVDSTMLCAEIRYGLRHDKPVDDADVPGLSKGERLNAGTVVLILADTKEHPGELPLESLGRNSANLQQYRVK
jgi:hypothetical protein